MLALFAPRTPATDPCHIRQVHPSPELPALWFPSPRRVGPTDVYSNLVYTCQASFFPPTSYKFATMDVVQILIHCASHSQTHRDSPAALFARP